MLFRSEGRKEVNLAAFALARRNLFHTALERVFTHRSLWLATRHHAQPRKTTVGNCAISDRLVAKVLALIGNDWMAAARHIAADPSLSFSIFHLMDDFQEAVKQLPVSEQRQLLADIRDGKSDDPTFACEGRCCSDSLEDRLL